jgi:hypothetical protein
MDEVERVSRLFEVAEELLAELDETGPSEHAPYLLETLDEEPDDEPDTLPDTLIDTAPMFLIDELDLILDALPTAPTPAVRSWPPHLLPAEPSRSRLSSMLDALKGWLGRSAA